jgi:hypothetical protein
MKSPNLFPPAPWSHSGMSYLATGMMKKMDKAQIPPDELLKWPR